jgi:hypothetical protein
VKFPSYVLSQNFVDLIAHDAFLKRVQVSRMVRGYKGLVVLSSWISTRVWRSHHRGQRSHSDRIPPHGPGRSIWVTHHSGKYNT